MGKSLATFAALIIIVALIAAGIYVYNNVRRDFEVEGTLRLFSEKGLGNTPCGFTGIIDYDNISYQIAVPKDKCDAYRLLEDKSLRVLGTLVIENTWNQPDGSQVPDNKDIFIIYPKKISKIGMTDN